MEPESSSPYPQVPATRPYPEPDRYQYDSLILSPDTGGLPELLPLHKQPVSWNFLLQSQTNCLVGGGMPYRLLKRRGTRVTEFVFANSSTQRAFSTTVAAILRQCFKGADVVLTSRKNAWKNNFISPLRYYPNCVSTTVTVLILRNVESVFLLYVVTLYTQYWTAYDIETHKRT